MSVSKRVGRNSNDSLRNQEDIILPTIQVLYKTLLLLRAYLACLKISRGPPKKEQEK